jgi:hypothetical protein
MQTNGDARFDARLRVIKLQNVSRYTFMVAYIITRLIFAVWSAVIAAEYPDETDTDHCRSKTTRTILIPYCVLEFIAVLFCAATITAWIIEEKSESLVLSFAAGILNELCRVVYQCFILCIAIVNLSLLITMSVYAWRDYDGCKHDSEDFWYYMRGFLILNWSLSGATLVLIIIAQGMILILKTNGKQSEEEQYLTEPTVITQEQ